jgi:hypothetical protein
MTTRLAHNDQNFAAAIGFNAACFLRPRSPAFDRGKPAQFGRWGNRLAGSALGA